MKPFELLPTLKQDLHPVDFYIEQFEELLAQIGDLPEDQCLGYFINGLHDDLKFRVKLTDPDQFYMPYT